MKEYHYNNIVNNIIDSTDTCECSRLDVFSEDIVFKYPSLNIMKDYCANNSKYIFKSKSKFDEDDGIVET